MEEQQVEEKSGSGVGKFVGAVGGGAAAGGLTYRHLGNKAIRNVVDVAIDGTEMNKKFAEELAKEGATEEKVAEKLGLKRTMDRMEKLDRDKIEKAVGEEALKLAGKENVLKAGAEISKLTLLQGHTAESPLLTGATFTQGSDGKFKAVFDLHPEKVEELARQATNDSTLTEMFGISADKIPEAGKKSQEAFAAELRTGKITIEGLEHLPTGLTLVDGKAVVAAENLTEVLGATGQGMKVEAGWLEHAAEARAKPIMQEIGGLTATAARKVGGFGWSFGNLSTGGKAGVVGMAVAGAAVGAMVLNKVFGGKHTTSVEASRAEEPNKEAAR